MLAIAPRDLAADGIVVIAIVSVHDFAISKLFEPRSAGCAVGHLAAGEHEGDRTALGVGRRATLRRAPAAQATDRLITAKFAQWLDKAMSSFRVYLRPVAAKYR